MTIQYKSIDAFHDGVYALVTRGLTFKADAENLTINLLGGY